MQASFADEKLEFYYALRKDSTVKQQNAESKIRNRTEELIRYIHQADYVRFMEKRSIAEKQQERKEQQMAQLQDKKRKADLENDFRYRKERLENRMASSDVAFADVREITYRWSVVEEWKSKLGLFSKIVALQNPDILFTKLLARMHATILKKREFELPKKLQPLLYELCGNISSHPSDQEKLATHYRLLQASEVYAIRTIELLRLADAKELMLQDYRRKEIERRDRTLEEGDISWLTAQWVGENLPPLEIGIVADHFARQAKIDGYRFQILLLGAYFLADRKDDVGLVKVKYQNLLKDYTAQGHVKIEKQRFL